MHQFLATSLPGHQRGTVRDVILDTRPSPVERREAWVELDSAGLAAKVRLLHKEKSLRGVPVEAALWQVQKEPPPCRTVWIGNISHAVTEQELLYEFGRHGAVRSVRIMEESACAFVNFDSPRDALSARLSLQDVRVGDWCLKLSFAREDKNWESLTSSRLLWVGGLSDDASKEGLTSRLQLAGKVDHLHLLPATHKGKASAVIAFHRLHDAVTTLGGQCRLPCSTAPPPLPAGCLLGAQAAPTHPGAPPGQIWSLPWPQHQTGPKWWMPPLSTTRWPRAI